MALSEFSTTNVSVAKKPEKNHEKWRDLSGSEKALQLSLAESGS
jgi:hypothetical protein